MYDDYDNDEDDAIENDPQFMSIIKEELFTLLTEIETFIEDDTQPYADEYGVGYLTDLKYQLLEIRSTWQ